MASLALPELNHETLKEHLAKAESLKSTDPTTALSILTAILQTFQQFDTEATFHAAVGACHFNLSNKSLALVSFSKAGELDPTNIAACTNAGSLAKSLEQFDNAVHWFTIVLQTDPKNSTALMQLAATCLAMPQPNYDQALSSLNTLLSLPSDQPNFRAHELKAFAAYKSNTSISMLDDWKTVKPFHAQLNATQKQIFAVNLSTLSMGLMKNKEYESALALHLDVNLLTPSANNYFNHAACLVKMQRANEAIPVFRLSLNEDPQFVKATLGLSSLLLMTKVGDDVARHTAEAKDLLVAATAEGQALATHVDALFNLSVAFMNLNQEKEAHGTLLRVVKCSNGTHWKAAALVANIEINQKHWGKGIDMLEQARNSSNAAQADFSVHFNLGICHLNLDDPVKALKHFEIAHSIDPLNPNGIQAKELLSAKTTVGSGGSGSVESGSGAGGEGGEGNATTDTATKGTSGEQTPQQLKDDDFGHWEWYWLDSETEENNGPFTVQVRSHAYVVLDTVYNLIPLDFSLLCVLCFRCSLFSLFSVLAVLCSLFTGHQSTVRGRVHWCQHVRVGGGVVGRLVQNERRARVARRVRSAGPEASKKEEHRQYGNSDVGKSQTHFET